MFIIIKQCYSNSEVLDIFYCDNITLIRNWIKEYINIDIVSYSYTPIEKNIRDIEYEIKDNQDSFELLKKYKSINKGYIYNSSEYITESIYSIRIYNFDKNKNTKDYNINLGSNMWGDINKEINNRVLKQLEKDCLLEIFNTIQEKINTRISWNNTEFINLISETIKHFKTNLYKSISKRIKQTNKKNNLYKKNRQNKFNIIQQYQKQEYHYQEEYQQQEEYDQGEYQQDEYQQEEYQKKEYNGNKGQLEMEKNIREETKEESCKEIQINKDIKSNRNKNFKISSGKLESLKSKLD